MEQSIYIFSGLGADERVFHELDFTGFRTTYIKWLPPAKNQPIEKYASRLLAQITARNPVLIGLSFGGMVAVEVAKQIKVEKVILVASAKGRRELPFYYRLAGAVGLHKLLPAQLLKQPNFISNWAFGAVSAADKALLSAILKDTDAHFLKWAINAIVHWQNTIALENIYHIHGTADRVLPIRFVNCNYSITGGGHFMTVNKASEVTSALRAGLS